MTEDETLRVVFGVLCLVLVLSAFVGGRRLPFGTLIRAVAGWVVVFGVLWIAVGHRDRISSAFADFEQWAGLGDQRVAGGMVRIRQSDDGHFWARVTINGVTRRMLIDSGATVTALSEDTARAFGIAIDKDRAPMVIDTANGEVPAWPARVERLSIDTLHTDDIEVVVSPDFGDTDVIGMNFLSRLKSWRVEGRTLILDPGGDAAKPVDGKTDSKDDLT